MPADHELLEIARSAAANAYAPYSDFHVGAAVLSDGAVYTGANVENAAYGSTLCAEAVAIGHAVASGVRSIEVIAVSCTDARGPCYPCGNCRQLMREFGVERIVVEGSDGAPIAATLDDLMPHSFGPEDLSR